MEYMERFQKLSQDAIGDSEAIIAVIRFAQSSSMGLYRIEENEIRSDNNALMSNDEFDEILWDAYNHFSKGIHLYRYANKECVDERYISHFNPDLIFSGADRLVIYQEYGLKPQCEDQKKELEEAIKAEKIKNTLVYACYVNDNDKIMEHLKKEKLSNAQLNKVLKLCGTPLILCAKNDNLQAFQMIAERGADIGKKFLGRETALMAAVVNSYDIVRYIFENYREQFEKEIKDFSCATSCEDIRTLEMLKDLGYDMSGEGQKHPILHRFVDSRNLVGIKFLLDNGVDINMRNTYGQTALERAERNAWTEGATLLIKYQ